MHVLEKFHIDKPELKIFIVYFPKEKQHLLPTWITPIDDAEDLPDNCIALFDESALAFHAHKWHKKETEIMDMMISISGQKHQTFIFVTHTMRKFAVTLLLDINVLLVKKPSLLHSKLERNEFRKLIEKIDREFDKLPKEDVKRSTYVVSEDFEGFITNNLPSFWNDELSEAYAGVSIKKKEEQVEEIALPYKIESGLKVWFKESDIERVLHILSKNSTIDGVLSELGVQCAGGNCYYSFDLKKGRDDKYYLINDRFDIEKSMKELADEKISFVVDVESAYPLTKEDVMFKIEEKKALETKNNLEEYGKKVKL